MVKVQKSKKDPYKIYQASREASLGYWIIPLITLIIIGLFYIFLTYQAGSRDQEAISEEMNKLEIKANQNIDNIIESRSHFGPLLNLNELPWGKDNPFTPE